MASALITRFAALLCACMALPASAAQAVPADLILRNAFVWTGDPANPRAQAIAVRGNRIVAVGGNSQVDALRGPGSRVIDLRGRMVVPGFIDAHTHFENATDWFFEARLIDVDDEATMLKRLGEVTARVPEGLWITGVEWGGMSARRQHSAGDRDYAAFEPALAAIDAATPRHPVLLQRHDGSVFVNSLAMERLRLTPQLPDPAGGRIGRDRTAGRLTGMLYGVSALTAVRSLPPKSRARSLIAARALVAELNRNGITGIHDIARVDVVSQEMIYRTHVERSHGDLAIFEDLRAEGKLSVRVYANLPLRSFDKLAAHGVKPGSGDEWIRFGLLKGYVDGTLMFEPWANEPAYSGNFTMRVVDEETMQRDVIGADRLGFDVATHAYGDKAHWHMLNWYEKAAELNGPRDRRFRLVHALYLNEREVERAARLGAVADITTHWAVTDAGYAERVLGPRRIGNAHAWRTMGKRGLRLNIVSDWPGTFDKTEVMPLNPLENIYYAVARRPIGAAAADAWHPEQALTVEEALRAYTVNPAWSSREESIKGTLAVGRLADIVVLAANILEIPVEQLPSVKVLYTIVDGRIVHQAP